MEILKIYQEEQFLIKCYLIKHLILLKNPKDDGYQRGLTSLVYIYFDKHISSSNTSACAVKSKIV